MSAEKRPFPKPYTPPEKSADSKSSPKSAAKDKTADDRIQKALKRLRNTEQLSKARAEMVSAQALFERGRYKQAIARFQAALAEANPMTALGGEVQIWLVNAYTAAGQQHEAVTLCRKLITHPDLETQRQSKRLLYILEAPELERKPEWTTQIPDLANLEEDAQLVIAQKPKRPRKRKPKPEPEPLPLSEVNTGDNQFLWLALILVLVTFGSLVWLS